MKYEVRLQPLENDGSEVSVPMFFELDKSRFDILINWLDKNQIEPPAPEGVPVDETTSETPAPVFEPPTATEMPAEATEAAPDATDEG